MTAPDPFKIIPLLNTAARREHHHIHIQPKHSFGHYFLPHHTYHHPQLQTKTKTMNALLQRALRPASRRVVRSASLATAAPARWQSTNTGAPFDPVVRGEMGVGELEGAEFKIEPLRRTGEDPETMRARLTCTFLSFSLSPLMFFPGSFLSPPPPSNYPSNVVVSSSTILLHRKMTLQKTMRLNPHVHTQTSPASAAPSSPTSSSRPSPRAPCPP